MPTRYGQAARTEGPPPTGNAVEESENVMKAFLARMPAVREAVVHDIRAAYDGDPAGFLASTDPRVVAFRSSVPGPATAGVA